MTDTQQELHQVREMLQDARTLNRGLTEDNAALQRDLAEISAKLAATEQRLEDVTSHRDRLLREKEQFNGWVLESSR